MKRPNDEEQPGPVDTRVFETLLSFHAKGHHTSVSPEDDIVTIRIISTFKEVEKQVFDSNVDVSRVGA